MPTKKSAQSVKPAKWQTNNATNTKTIQSTAMPGSQRLRLLLYRPFRLKRVKHPVRLPSVWVLTQKMAVLLWSRKWIFLGIGVVYCVLNAIFVQGMNGGADVGSLQGQLSRGLGGNGSDLAAGFANFTGLLAAAGNGASAVAGVYQMTLGIIVTLATIWALRQAAAGGPMRLKDPFYKGMYPMVPFVLVMMVALLQTVPFLIGGMLYGLVVTYGIAFTVLEQLLWGALFLVLAAISALMLCSSLFALYIVTLPDMTPMKALRAARKLVQYRRAAVLRKLLFLPVLFLLAAVVVMVPVVLFVPFLAPWFFFLFAMFGLIVAHAYMYALYRELLA